MSNYQFSPTSRYYNLDTVTLEDANGNKTVYLERRFVPAPEDFALLQTYVVKQGDRLDNITAQYLDDPQQFWRLCDANGAMRPTS